MRPRNAETDEIAQRLHVSKRQAQRIRSQGLTLERIMEHREAKLRKIPLETESSNAAGYA
jgi:hypothetical protein